MPSTGIKIIGRIEVTGIGTISVIHHNTIQAIKPVTIQAAWLIAVAGGGRIRVSKSNKGPQSRSKRLVIIDIDNPYEKRPELSSGPDQNKNFKPKAAA
jgi:hypothetical protein